MDDQVDPLPVSRSAKQDRGTVALFVAAIVAAVVGSAAMFSDRPGTGSALIAACGALNAAGAIRLHRQGKNRR